MALSFEESKRMAAEMAAKAEPVALQAEAAPMAAVVDMPQAQANDDGGYTRSENTCGTANITPMRFRPLTI